MLWQYRFTQDESYSDNDEHIEFDLDQPKYLSNALLYTHPRLLESRYPIPAGIKIFHGIEPNNRIGSRCLSTNDRGTIDTAAETSCITLDLATKTNMNITNKEIPIYLANRSVIFCAGLATGHLTFAFDGPGKNVHIKASKLILPGKDQLLIGCDLLSTLGLMNDSGVYIRTDEEHRKFLVAEALFDSLIISCAGSFRNQRS
ncbi:hypothetical protein GEMRC1_009640 [Eukaryota sp. GEM-RC1]